MTGDPATSGTAVRIRKATEADRAGTELLCAAALDFDTRWDAKAYPATLTRRATTHLVAVESGPDGEQIVGTVIGSLNATADGAADGTERGDVTGRTVGHLDLIAVSPAARRRGIGRRLLTALEDRMRADGCRELVVKGNPPWYAWPGVDVRYTPAICLFEHLGFVQDGETMNMATTLRGRGELFDTTTDERRLAGDGITVRRLAPYDRDSIRPWLEGWGGTWTDEALAALWFDPVRCHVALDADGRWLGFAAWGVNAPSVFGPMGTAESSRGKGIGSVLLRRCLADQYVEELDLAEIGWVGPYEFYCRTVGAYISRVFWSFRKSLV